MHESARVASQSDGMRQSRRKFLTTIGQLAGLGSISVLAACQSPPETIFVTPPPANAVRAQPTPTGAPAAVAPAAISTPAPVAAPTTAPVAAVATAPAVPAAAPTTAAASAPVTTVPSVASAPVEGRPMYQMNPQHTGRSLHAGPERGMLRHVFDTASPNLALLDPGDPRPEIQSSAAIAPDGTVYIGNFPGGLYALRSSGPDLPLDFWWRFHPPGASSFHATPALGPDGTVYIGFSTGGATPEARGTFYAIQGTSGRDAARALWSVDLGPGRQTSSPTLADDGTIYVVSGAGTLFAIAPDGAVRWTAKVGPTVKTSPALAGDGTVYVASMNGKLYAVSPPAGDGNEGAVRWTFEFGQHPGRTPLVTAPVPPPGADGVGSGASPMIAPDGMIYLGANNSNLYAITPDGSLRWLFEAEREVAGIWSTPALGLDDRTLYFGANKGGIYAVDRQAGTLRWQFDIFGSVYSSPTLDSRGVLYTGSTIGHVFALSADDGGVIWDVDVNAPVWSAPALRPDGSLVVADTRGRVMVLAEG